MTKIVLKITKYLIVGVYSLTFNKKRWYDEKQNRKRCKAINCEWFIFISINSYEILFKYFNLYILYFSACIILMILNRESDFYEWK